MSKDNYMEVAEGLSEVFGVSKEAFARVDFSYLSDMIGAMNIDGESLGKNLSLLISGQTTYTAEQARIAEVNKIMIDEIRIMRIHDKKLREYMIKYLTMMMTVSSVFLIKEGSRESIDKKKELWHYLKEKDKVVARKVNMQALSGPMHLRGKAGRKLIVWGYSIARKIYGFN